MGTFVLGIIVLIFGLVAGMIIFPDVTKRDGKKIDKSKYRGAIRILGVVFGCGLILFSCMSFVPTGHTGIQTTFGRVNDGTLDAGLAWHAPWVSVVNMDNREQRVPFVLEAFSKDIQQVDIQGSINSNINKATAMNLYREVGVNYVNVFVTPRIQEDVKIVIARYTAENLISNRQVASDTIYELIKEELTEKGINVISLALENVDFQESFENAVEAKQVAAQNKLAEETRQAQKTMEEEAAAKRAIIMANAEAEKAKIAAQADLEVVKIQAEAALYAGEKEAEMNKRISEALTPELIRYYWIKQWNGKLPTVSTDNAMTLIDMNDINKVAD